MIMVHLEVTSELLKFNHTTRVGTRYYWWIRDVAHERLISDITGYGEVSCNSPSNTDAVIIHTTRIESGHNSRAYWWSRSICSSSSFTCLHHYGYAHSGSNSSDAVIFILQEVEVGIDKIGIYAQFITVRLL